MFLNNEIINKTKVLLPLAKVTKTHKTFKLFGFPIVRFWAYQTRCNRYNIMW